LCAHRASVRPGARHRKFLLNRAKKSAPRRVRLQFGHVPGHSVNAGSIYQTCVSSKLLSGNGSPIFFYLSPNSYSVPLSCTIVVLKVLHHNASAYG
jgi:hypothetical protein